ncbi:hypothetical protein PG996_001896 [Apiospora saccharicola]|uniref:Uncharacterized protein n=1 Tax=Apiospora saccharicola TaxID=335842 RepID=A0ABR1WHY5_9PEZI
MVRAARGKPEEGRNLKGVHSSQFTVGRWLLEWDQCNPAPVSVQDQIILLVLLATARVVQARVTTMNSISGA